MHPEPAATPSFQITARGLIADRAKDALYQLLKVHPSEPRGLDAAAVVDQLVRSLCIMHDYRLEQVNSAHNANSFLFEQMQELLDALIERDASRAAPPPTTRA
ncbi:MAG: hypothetical protein MUC36_17565 [Planctomycetes bacterium]|nr:hypothetical protein [Planctomycetota bacterium]